MDVSFFKSPAHFRKWLEKNHARADHLWVGFYKTKADKSALTYKEAVDQALCFGWIDGLRKNVDAVSYTNRFTPRKATSNWSVVNMARVAELKALGLMMPPGLDAFERRKPKKAGRYSYEQRPSTLGGVYRKTFQSNPKAWTFFRAQAPWYQRTATWWIVSAVKEETRLKRLAVLMSDSADGRRLRMLTPRAAGEPERPSRARAR